ncbi:MAG: hypothetical protein HY080_15185 [Gammaproteobacteria bacterium]|nr:hypothetical protein [Gammaproteobacteria bacterium]
MTLNFKTLAVLSAVLCFVLACTWMFAPKFLLTVWGVSYTDSAGLVARRGAGLFVAIGTMFYVARNSEISLPRYGLIIGFALGCTTLATLGIFELVSGHAGLGILSAVVVEVAFAIAFIILGRYDHSHLLRKI